MVLILAPIDSVGQIKWRDVSYGYTVVTIFYGSLMNGEHMCSLNGKM